MSITTHRIIEAFYNVDGGYWCDSKGNYCLPSLIPTLRKNEMVALKLHLIHNYGDYSEEVVDFASTMDFALVCYDEDGSELFKAENSSINSSEGLAIWDEADSRMGKFIVLFRCFSSALNTLLADSPVYRATIEFTAYSGTTVIALYREKVYLEQTNTTLAILDEDEELPTGLTSGEVEVTIGTSSVFIEVDPTLFQILSCTMQMPGNADGIISVMSYSVSSTGFTFYLSATVPASGYYVHYSYIEKE